MYINIDLEGKDHNVSTFGGEGNEVGLEYDCYGIQIGDVSLDGITSSVALRLIRVLSKHLIANWHDLTTKGVQNDQ